MEYIKLTEENIKKEHICCAISDKKCTSSYNAKKEWLKNEFKNGYNFVRLNERAKVFIEYVPSGKSWSPVKTSEYMQINCLWVSGKYKKNGHAKKLLGFAIDDAKKLGLKGLITVVGSKKNHFMSDGKWFKKQGFEVADQTVTGFELLVHKFEKNSTDPEFMLQVKNGICDDKKGLVVYYSNMCPFTEYHVTTSLQETVKNRNLNLKVYKIDSLEKAKDSPTPANIFSLFMDGKFITTDLSVCMDSRFDKILNKIV